MIRFDLHDEQDMFPRVFVTFFLVRSCSWLKPLGKGFKIECQRCELPLSMP
jgi:hypothetical protein